jgi:hypothetical protein
MTSSLALLAASGLWIASNELDSGRTEQEAPDLPNLSVGIKKAHYQFTQHDIQPIVAAMSNAGIYNFVCWIDPNTGALDVVTAIDSKPHLDLLPGHCPNNVDVNNPTGECDHDGDDGDGDGDGDGDDGDDGHGHGHGGHAATLLAATMHTGLLGNAFDVTQVDISTVRLSLVDQLVAGANEIAPLDASFADVGTPFEGTSCNCTSAGADGTLDISMHFDWTEVIDAFDLQSEPNHALVPVKSTGMLTNGRAIFGVRDCIRVINN